MLYSFYGRHGSGEARALTEIQPPKLTLSEPLGQDLVVLVHGWEVQNLTHTSKSSSQKSANGEVLWRSSQNIIEIFRIDRCSTWGIDLHREYSPMSCYLTTTGEKRNLETKSCAMLFACSVTYFWKWKMLELTLVPDKNLHGFNEE